MELNIIQRTQTDRQTDVEIGLCMRSRCKFSDPCAVAARLGWVGVAGVPADRSSAAAAASVCGCRSSPSPTNRGM